MKRAKQTLWEGRDAFEAKATAVLLLGVLAIAGLVALAVWL